MDTVTVVIASYFIAIPITVVLYELSTLPKAERRRFTALLLVGGIIALILAKIGATLFSDPRPFLKGHFDPLVVAYTENGFPSDHTILAALIGFTMLSISKRIGCALLVVALAIGLARMAAGVHHSLDILGSFVIAGVSYLLARALVNYIIRRRAKRSLNVS